MTDIKFEDALERLELIVDQLEAGNLALEESLKVFEEGVGARPALRASTSTTRRSASRSSTRDESGAAHDAESLALDEDEA